VLIINVLKLIKLNNKKQSKKLVVKIKIGCRFALAKGNILG
jgi:hypothetical protein